MPLRAGELFLLIVPLRRSTHLGEAVRSGVLVAFTRGGLPAPTGVSVFLLRSLSVIDSRGVGGRTLLRALSR